MATEPSSKPSSPRPIKPEFWDLPVTFGKKNGQPITLRQFVDGAPDAIPFKSLTHAQRTDLAARRITGQPQYEIALLGTGIYDSKACVKEIRAGSDLGLHLTNIESRVVQYLLNIALKGNE
jgi:hypothetical protein